jgi:hypothetical protein
VRPLAGDRLAPAPRMPLSREILRLSEVGLRVLREDSIANGDLSIASGVLTVLQTLGSLYDAHGLALQFAGARSPCALARYLFRRKDIDSAVEAITSRLA